MIKITYEPGEKSRKAAWLILRVTVGAFMLFFHGWGKLAGGEDKWAALGGSMSNLGITFAPVFWGLMAALAESVGGALLALGIFARTAAFFIGMTMIVAAVQHYSRGEYTAMTHPLELLAVMLLFITHGAGEYSLQRLLRK